MLYSQPMPDVHNASLTVEFDLSQHGISISRIRDVSAQRDYLPSPSPFFKYAVNNGTAFTSDSGVSANVEAENPDGSVLSIIARSNDNTVGFRLRATLPWDSSVALFALTAVNLTQTSMFLRVVLPCIQGVRTPGEPANMMGMIPSEAGTVVPLSTAHPWHIPPNPLGMPFFADLGLPNARNNMELVSIFDAAIGGGVFFCDVDGELDNEVAPLQFTLSPLTVTGFWIGTIPPGASVQLPQLAIGVHPDGDWHRAIDYYTSVHRPRWTFPNTPAWFRETGATYTPSGWGAGGIHLSLPPSAWTTRIGTFENLAILHAEAQALGTNVLYLVDWYEGSPDPYANKGDYIPRTDNGLGGAVAFAAGIDNVHRNGGRVLLYVEPFIIFKNSSIAQRIGQAWGGRRFDGKLWGLDVQDLYPDYACNYEMVSCHIPWQDYVVSVAQRLVGEYHADGIMLDSYAWQMNRLMMVGQDPSSGQFSSYDYAQGVLWLVHRVRAAVQAINPEAVVIGETTAGPVARYWDGGFNADLGFFNIWLDPKAGAPWRGTERLMASPVRYGIPEVRIFGNGWDLNGLHQFYAAGHGLALCANVPGPPGQSFMFDHADHIRRLVEIRTTYGDALIHGTQINQPRSNNAAVVAYQYLGSRSRVIVAVNIEDFDTTANISLDTPDPGGRWINLLPHKSLSPSLYTKDGMLELTLSTSTGEGSILVLLHSDFDPGRLPKAVERP